jgi:uncharacterized phage infection (PIP) family protein YhgE
MHTYFEMDGNYLVAKCYLVAIDTPVFFEMRIDTSRVLDALRQGHSYLHNQVSGVGMPVNLIGAKTSLVTQVANTARSITRQISESQPVHSSAAHAAYAAADSLLASVERKNLIQNAAAQTKRNGHVSDEVKKALPALKAQAQDGRIAGEVIKTVIGAAHQTVIGAGQLQTSMHAQATEQIFRHVHSNRQNLRDLGARGVTTGRVVDENGNIQSRIALPIQSVKQAVPQLAAAVAGVSSQAVCIGKY